MLGTQFVYMSFNTWYRFDIVWQKSMQEAFSKCVPNISSCLQNDLDWPLNLSEWLKIDIAMSISRNMASGPKDVN